jgi:hypothetical protein
VIVIVCDELPRTNKFVKKYKETMTNDLDISLQVSFFVLYRKRKLRSAEAED